MGPDRSARRRQDHQTNCPSGFYQPPTGGSDPPQMVRGSRAARPAAIVRSGAWCESFQNVRPFKMTAVNHNAQHRHTLQHPTSLPFNTPAFAAARARGHEYAHWLEGSHLTDSSNCSAPPLRSRASKGRLRLLTAMTAARDPHVDGAVAACKLLKREH